MVQFLIRSILIRTAIVFVFIHVGVLLAVYGLARISQLSEIDQNVWWILLVGVALLYGGFLVGIFLLVWPIYSITRKIRYFLHWRDWILKELPQIIALIPTLVQAVREAFSTFNTNQNSKSDPSQSRNHPAKDSKDTSVG